jgi:hypothetical protein
MQATYKPSGSNTNQLVGSSIKPLMRTVDKALRRVPGRSVFQATGSGATGLHGVDGR